MSIHERLQIKSRHGYTLVGELQMPKGNGPFPVVIFCHGYRSSKASSKIVSMVQVLQNSYACFRFDFSGHGESGGDLKEVTPTRCSEDLDDCITCLRQGKESLMKQLDMNKVILYGSSFGGCVAIMTAARHSEVKAMLLFAPASDYRERKDACEQAKLNSKQAITLTLKRRQLTFELYCKLVEDAARYDFYKLAQKITCPVIIFHGDADDIIPINQSKKLEKAFPDAWLEIIPHADHLFNDDPQMERKLAQQSKAFLTARLLP